MTTRLPRTFAALLIAALAVAGCREDTGAPDPECLADEVCNSACARGEDPDCVVAGCREDGVCNDRCGSWDPDCVEESCGADELCNPRCPADPDCVGTCTADGTCDADCLMSDPDCVALYCSADGACDDRCPPGEDPDCGELDCSADGTCVADCGLDDPDCAAAGCDADDFCNPACEGADPDCDDPGCTPDGYCNPDCPDDPDCVETCGIETTPCCDGHSCLDGLACVELGRSSMCLRSCARVPCGSDAEDGSCVAFAEFESPLCVSAAVEPTGCEPGSACGSPDVGDGFCVELFQEWEVGSCLAPCDSASTGCFADMLCMDLTILHQPGPFCVPRDLSVIWD